MEAAADLDLELLKASHNLLAELQQRLEQLCWKSRSGAGKERGDDTPVVHRYARVRDLGQILSKLEPFQEDPQLLDTHLKSYLPSLVDAYLATFHHENPLPPKAGLIPLRGAICKVLYTFCKIRGEKVIASFLNNEPKYLEPLLGVFENEVVETSQDEASSTFNELTWEGRYILLLWLSHQMLTPFDLHTISSGTLPDMASIKAVLIGAQLPPDLPSVTLRVLEKCIPALAATARERNAAALCMVRLCLRPDMRRAGLLDVLVQWATGRLRLNAEADIDVHAMLGYLTFIARLTASGSRESLDKHLTGIYNLCRQILDDETFSTLQSSAVARKTIIKVFRCIILLSPQPGQHNFDTDVVLEEVIGSLLDLLADGDSPVRYAASKALSAIATSLEPEMSEDIVEAILESFNEDVLIQGSIRNLGAINPLRWHGLTLTLGHLLYKRAVPTNHLPQLLNSLILALNFEQRSATGSSIGSNVRDAANYGLWALSRRYTTSELFNINVNRLSVFNHGTAENTSITELMATELFQSACLDPAGNIRRGSSAALQEFIGRHPNTVTEGIALIQIVDYHAVGLRGRAMMDVAFNVSQLSGKYADALLDSLLGWRGIAAIDVAARKYAGIAFGRIVSAQSAEDFLEQIRRLIRYLSGLNMRQVEERQGLMLAVAETVDHWFEKRSDERTQAQIRNLWSSLLDALQLDDKGFISPALRPDLSASAFVRLTCSISTLAPAARTTDAETAASPWIPPKWLHFFMLCLQRSDEAMLDLMPGATTALNETLTKKARSQLFIACQDSLRGPSASATRKTGHALVLGALYKSAEQVERANIVQILSARCCPPVDIDGRVLALRGLGVVLQADLRHPHGEDELVDSDCVLLSAIIIGLNDYTNNERGDVGSLVRLAALRVVETVWTRASPREQLNLGVSERIEVEDRLYASVVRLALERLDKVRILAAQCLPHKRRISSGYICWIDRPIHSVQDTSTSNYFGAALNSMKNGAGRQLRHAIITGYTSSAGIGSEATLQTCRTALTDFLTSIPVRSDVNNQIFSLHTFATDFSQVLQENVAKDRVSIPMLEVLVYLLDMRLLCSLRHDLFRWRTLFVLASKFHFRTTNMQKLFLALDVYRGLILMGDDVIGCEREIRAKVVGMLLHPFPKVRLKAAECVWVCHELEGLKKVDWTRPVKELKDVVADLQNAMVMDSR